MADQPSSSDRNARYIPVRIGTLRPWAAVNFDVFIQVGERHLQYIRKSDPFDGDRIEALKAKGVRKLFIPADSESDYLRYLDEGLDQLKDSAVKIEDRGLLARDSLLSSAESVEQDIQTENGYRKTERQLSKITDFLNSESGAMRQMLGEGAFSQDIYQHSTNVVTLAIRLALLAGIQAPQTLAEIGVAGLLHDLGKLELPLDASLPRESLKPEQRLIYEQHPHKALDRIRDKPYITQSVLKLILDHEELGEGAGFPGRKRLSTLPLEQQILNLCNEYDRVCTVNRVPPLEAMKQFYVDKLGLFPLELLNRFSAMIKQA